MRYVFWGVLLFMAGWELRGYLERKNAVLTKSSSDEIRANSGYFEKL